MSKRNHLSNKLLAGACEIVDVDISIFELYFNCVFFRFESNDARVATKILVPFHKIAPREEIGALS